MLWVGLCWKDVVIAVCFDIIASCAPVFILDEPPKNAHECPWHGLRTHATVPLLPSRWLSTVTSRRGNLWPFMRLERLGNSE